MSSLQNHPTGTPAEARLGRWVISGIPHGWFWLPEFGMQRMVEGAAPSNVSVREDLLDEDESLAAYVTRQMALMRKTFLEPTVAGPAPLKFSGAEEAMLVMVKHQRMGQARIFQVQHYVRSGSWTGVVTLTTIESELLTVRPEFEQFLKLIRIESAQTERSTV